MTVERMLVPLSAGEIGTIRRALRYYQTAERDSMVAAQQHARACKKQGSKECLNYLDVAQQASTHVAAAGVLLDRLLKDPLMQGDQRLVIPHDR